MSINEVVIETVISRTETKLTTVLEKFDTEHKQNKFFIEEMKIIMPKKIIMGQTFEPDKHSFKLSKKDHVGYYVPFRESLKNLLEHPSLQSKLEFKKQNLLKKDIVDGFKIKNNEIYQQNEKPYIIAIYYDEIEVVNAIGCHRTKHKLGRLKKKFNLKKIYAYLNKVCFTGLF